MDTPLPAPVRATVVGRWSSSPWCWSRSSPWRCPPARSAYPWTRSRRGVAVAADPEVSRRSTAPDTTWGRRSSRGRPGGHRGQVVPLRARRSRHVRRPASPDAGSWWSTTATTRTTYEPVTANVRVGDVLARGQPIGTLELAGSHCFPRTCLHWGWRRGSTYLDPLLLVGGGPIVLLPLWREPLTPFSSATAPPVTAGPRGPGAAAVRRDPGVRSIRQGLSGDRARLGPGEPGRNP